MCVSHRIETFREDLTNLENYELLLKYIYSSKIWYFYDYLGCTEGECMNMIDSLHLSVSDSFGVSFKNVIVVGSAKIGFSLNPNNPLRSFDSDNDKPSDLDVAIVSSDYFRRCWDMLRSNTSIRYRHNYNKVSRSVYNGYVPFAALQEVKEIRKDFNDSKRRANIRLQKEIGIRHSVNFRVYRSWRDLEDYHVVGIEQIKRKVRNE